MNEAAWDIDSEQGFHEFAFVYRGEMLRDILMLLPMPFYFVFAVKNPMIAPIATYGVCALFDSLFVAKKWVFHRDRVCFQSQTLFSSQETEYPWINPSIALIIRRPSSKRVRAFTTGLPRGDAAWTVEFYDDQHQLLLTMQDLKYGDARWLVDQISKHV